MAGLDDVVVGEDMELVDQAKVQANTGMLKRVKSEEKKRGVSVDLNPSLRICQIHMELAQKKIHCE